MSFFYWLTIYGLWIRRAIKYLGISLILATVAGLVLFMKYQETECDQFASLQMSAKTLRNQPNALLTFPQKHLLFGEPAILYSTENMFPLDLSRAMIALEHTVEQHSTANLTISKSDAILSLDPNISDVRLSASQTRAAFLSEQFPRRLMSFELLSSREVDYEDISAFTWLADQDSLVVARIEKNAQKGSESTSILLFPDGSEIKSTRLLSFNGRAVSMDVADQALYVLAKDRNVNQLLIVHLDGSNSTEALILPGDTQLMPRLVRISPNNDALLFVLTETVENAQKSTVYVAYPEKVPALHPVYAKGGDVPICDWLSGSAFICVAADDSRVVEFPVTSQAAMQSSGIKLAAPVNGFDYRGAKTFFPTVSTLPQDIEKALEAGTNLATDTAYHERESFCQLAFPMNYAKWIASRIAGVTLPTDELYKPLDR